MGETCAVCNKGTGPERCEICGFSDNGRINREVLTIEDGNYWLETVVKPYRIQWEAQKREAEFLRRTNELEKHEAELVAQLEESLKREAELQAIIKTQRQTADTVKPPISDGFVKIPGGTFTMGSPVNEAGRRDNEIQHQVTVSGFYMGKYEVTQSEWEELMGTNPSNSKGYNLPVEQVSWYEAVEYCNKRSVEEKLSPVYTIDKTRKDPGNENDDKDNKKWMVTWDRSANGYRLPTEAEWEYACRAGTTTPFNTGNNITTDQANYNGNYPYNNNPKGINRGKTTPVGSFAPNSWGLYDMHGNVWEWCWDWYGDYASGFQTDPTGASSGSDRVIRGGGWGSDGQNLRSAERNYYGPSSRDGNVGFRVLRP